MKLRSTPTHRRQRAFPRNARVGTCHRITSFTRPGDEQSFSYDANGNRTANFGRKQFDTDLDGNLSPTDRSVTTQQTWQIEANSNRLTALSQQVTTTRLNAQGNPVSSQVSAQASYPSDAAGNLTSDGLRKFDYDAENRHSKTGVNDSDEGAKAIYLHNVFGQRVFKSEPQVDYTAPTETTLGTDFITWLKTNFKWLFAAAQANASLGSSYSYGDGQIPSWALLGEYNNGAATGSGRTEYIWLPTDDGQAIPIAMFRGSRYYAIHSDHLGTPRLMTDDTAKPVWQWPYSAFGETKPTGILTATANPNQAMTAAPLLKATAPAAILNLRYPGQYFDSETNLFYNSQRTYDPVRGSRYTQADPIGLDGGWNRFGYVNQSGLMLTDPEGLRVPGGSARQRRQDRREQAREAAAEAQRIENYYQRQAEQKAWIQGFFRTNDAWGNYADGVASLTGAGGRFRHPSMPNAIEHLISPDRINSDEPFLPNLPEPICRREAIR